MNATDTRPSHRMRPLLLLMLTLPPLLWGSNAVLGQLAAGSIAPVLLNVLRWSVALALLAPFALRQIGPHVPTLRAQWKFLLLSSFLGITCYNALQYLALTTSSALNISLIGAATPVFILISGRVFFGQRINLLSAIGALVSIAGVACVLARGDLSRLDTISFVPGDLFMLVAAFAWGLYTLLLKQSRARVPITVLLSVQIAIGLLCSLPFAAAEHLWGGYAPLVWGWREIAIVLYVGTMPSLLAYFCWQRAVSQTSAQLPVFFMNLTPLFTVSLAALMLNERPQAFHYIGLVLILGGIYLAHRSQPA